MSSELIELINYRISRSRETLLEAETMLQSGFLNGSINRTYYACYYAISALLLKHDIKTQTQRS